jgi:hypothetical protein
MSPLTMLTSRFRAFAFAPRSDSLSRRGSSLPSPASRLILQSQADRSPPFPRVVPAIASPTGGQPGIGRVFGTVKLQLQTTVGKSPAERACSLHPLDPPLFVASTSTTALVCAAPLYVNDIDLWSESGKSGLTTPAVVVQPCFLTALFGSRFPSFAR